MGLDLDLLGGIVGIVVKGVEVGGRPVELDFLLFGQLGPLGVGRLGPGAGLGGLGRSVPPPQPARAEQAITAASRSAKVRFFIKFPSFLMC